MSIAHNELEVYSARLARGEAAGSRRPGARGSIVALRRRAIAKLRGEQDVTSLLRHGLVVGKEVFIARGCYIDPGFAWLVSIGDEATIGPNVTILAHDASPKLRTGVSLLGAVRIGARVFIGANSTILPGVAIGDDAIVGAGTVVREDVEPGTIVIGTQQSRLERRRPIRVITVPNPELGRGISRRLPKMQPQSARGSSLSSQTGLDTSTDLRR